MLGFSLNSYELDKKTDNFLKQNLGVNCKVGTVYRHDIFIVMKTDPLIIINIGK